MKQCLHMEHISSILQNAPPACHLQAMWSFHATAALQLPVVPERMPCLVPTGPWVSGRGHTLVRRLPLTLGLGLRSGHGLPLMLAAVGAAAVATARTAPAPCGHADTATKQLVIALAERPAPVQGEPYVLV
jgi:hypothetical protein